MRNLIASIKSIRRKVKSTCSIKPIACLVGKFGLGNAKEGPFGIKASDCLRD